MTFAQDVVAVELSIRANREAKGSIGGDGNGEVDGEGRGEVNGVGTGEGEGNSDGEGSGDGNGSPTWRTVRGASGFRGDLIVEGILGGATG